MPKVIAIEEARATVAKIQGKRKRFCAQLSSEMRNHASGRQSAAKSYTTTGRLLQLLAGAQSIGLSFSETNSSDDAYSQVAADAWALVQQLRADVDKAYASARTTLAT